MGKTFTSITNIKTSSLRSQILNYNDKIFFNITGGQNQSLFVLDVNTGEVIEHFSGLCHEIFQEGKYIYTTKHENILCRLDSETLIMEEWDSNDLIKSKGFKSIQDYRCTIKNNKFYFTQSLGDTKAKFGILDWDKKELIYEYDFDPSNGVIGSVKVSDSRIFVHTQDKALHIFGEV